MALLSLHAPLPAQGAFALEITQQLNYAQLILQYLRQAQQLTEALKQTADMVRNSQVLPGQIFGPILADISALDRVVQGGQAISYSLANLDTVFRSRFPGYGYGSNAYFLKYKSWSQTSLDTTLGALRAAGLQSS